MTNLCFPKVIFVLTVLTISHNSFSQKKEEKSFIESINQDSDFKKFTSPSNDYESFVLQTHKGKIRFGLLNNYVLYPDGSYIPRETLNLSSAQRKQERIFQGKNAFIQLMEMKHMKTIYNDINKQILIKKNGNLGRTEKNAVLAQEHLLKTANMATK